MANFQLQPHYWRLLAFTGVAYAAAGRHLKLSGADRKEVALSAYISIFGAKLALRALTGGNSEMDPADNTNATDSRCISDV